MDSNVEIPTQVMSDSDEDEEECADNDYEMTSWNGNADEPAGFRFKGKTKFPKAVEFIKLKLKRSKTEKEINGLKYRVLSMREIDHGKEYDVEDTRDNDNGIASVKIFGPNK